MRTPLTEVPAPGFTFVEWLQSGSGTADTCQVSMDKNRKVVARFAPSP